jgi:hypothetical protein
MATYTITYDKVTPESAEDGDVSEHGFYLPGGYEYPIPDGCVGAEFTAWREATGPFDLPLETDEDTGVVDAAIAILREYGCDEPSCRGGGFNGDTFVWYSETDPDVDYRTGEETRKAVHFDGLTLAEAQAIYAAIVRR